jgi:hypothetical protein
MSTPTFIAVRAKDRGEAENRSQAMITALSAQPTDSSAEKRPPERPIRQSAFGPVAF